MYYPTISIREPLSSIRFIILTDGTVYENKQFENGKILTHAEYKATFEHLIPLLCENIPQQEYIYESDDEE